MLSPSKFLLFLFSYVMMSSSHMCFVHKIAVALVVIGAINWGLVGALDFNLVSWLFGSWMLVQRIIYILVGVAGIAMLFCGKCGKCNGSGVKMEIPPMKKM